MRPNPQAPKESTFARHNLYAEILMQLVHRNLFLVIFDFSFQRRMFLEASHDAASHMHSLNCAFMDFVPLVSQTVTMSHFCAHGRRTLPNSQSKFEFLPTPTPKKNWKGRKIKKKAFKLPLCHQLVQNRVTSSKESRYMKRGKLSLLFAYSVPLPTNFGWSDFFWKNSSK